MAAIARAYDSIAVTIGWGGFSLPVFVAALSRDLFAREVQEAPRSRICFRGTGGVYARRNVGLLWLPLTLCGLVLARRDGAEA